MKRLQASLVLPRRRAKRRHYDQVFKLNLSEQAKKDLIEYLKSL